MLSREDHIQMDRMRLDGSPSACCVAEAPAPGAAAWHLRTLSKLPKGGRCSAKR